MAQKLDINTYTFQSGNKVIDIDPERFEYFINGFQGNLEAIRDYASMDEYQDLEDSFKELESQYEEWKNGNHSTEMKNNILESFMHFDDYSRFLAANHWDNENQTFEVFNTNYHNYDEWRNEPVENEIPFTENLHTENQNNDLEQTSLDNAADLLKTMKFNKDNYKELLDVINKISVLNGKEQLQVPTEEQVKNIVSAKETSQPEKVGVGEKAPEEAPVTTKPFDPKAPVVYGKTVLPAFAVLVGDQLHSIENAVVKSHNDNKNSYIVDNGKETFELPDSTFETLLQDKIKEEQKQARLAEGKTIVFEDKARGVQGTVIPEWAMYTQNGLETFKDFVAQKYNAADNSYTLSNGQTTINVDAERFKEITAPERFETKYDENSPAYKKLCETQYNDYFKPRDNTAYNFRHNFSVFCRKEANSPCDALTIAKGIIGKMKHEEKKKTKELMKKMCGENETMNEFIVRCYHDAIKEMPMNEEYMKAYVPNNVYVRPFYDTISTNGVKIENDPALVKGGIDKNLTIGSTIKNINIETGKVFGHGKDSVHFDELKIISASKEGNSITVMDSNKSYIKLPRDTVLQVYKEQQQKELKQEHKHYRTNSMNVSYGY